MQKKFKFHCLDDDFDEISDSISNSSSDDEIPETNVISQIKINQGTKLETLKTLIESRDSDIDNHSYIGKNNANESQNITKNNNKIKENDVNHVTFLSENINNVEDTNPNLNDNKNNIEALTRIPNETNGNTEDSDQTSSSNHDDIKEPSFNIIDDYQDSVIESSTENENDLEGVSLNESLSDHSSQSHDINKINGQDKMLKSQSLRTEQNNKALKKKISSSKTAKKKDKHNKKNLDEKHSNDYLTSDSLDISSSIENNEINSIPDDSFEEMHDSLPEIDEITNPMKKHTKKSFISLKSQNNAVPRFKQLIHNTEIIFEYFNGKISKLTILKAIHAKCGDYHSALISLASNPKEFDHISLFRAPPFPNSEQTLKEYLK